MVCGFLPARMAFPIIASVLCGKKMNISNKILMQSLADFVPGHDSSIIREALEQSGDSLKTKLVDILSRLDCTEIPTPSNMRRLLISIAKYILQGKPLGILLTMRSGVPKCYQSFWQQFSMDKLYRLYKALSASPSSVLQSVSEPDFVNAAEERVYQFLRTYITKYEGRGGKTLPQICNWKCCADI